LSYSGIFLQYRFIYSIFEDLFTILDFLAVLIVDKSGLYSAPFII